MRKWLLRLVYTAAVLAPVGALANYAASVGVGTNFGSIAIGGVHFVSGLICDFTTANQCASVSASNALKVDASATTQPVSSATLATAANQTTEISSLATIATNTGAAIPAGTATIGNVGTITPAGATALTASATGTTAATTATLAGTGGKTTFLCWSSVRANATAAVTITNTITGVISGTLSRLFWVAPAASGLGVDEMIYNPCIPASATNTGIAVVSGAPGAGGNVTVTAGGYQL